MHLCRRIISALVCALFCPLLAFAQEEQQDSLVRLLSAKSAQVIEINEQSIRKVIGPARFLHNNTYLLCDTALWNVDTKIINAFGNVSIIQDGTVLTSDKLDYFIDNDLAEFRGSIVQLEDKDHNTLRTRHLDYNTKDSVAIFSNGGSMRDKDGQIIESRTGTYDSKIKTFTFDDNVNMFTDSIFVKTSSLVYESDLNLATFGRGTDAWQKENMLSSDAGWYNRNKELFFFNRNVHVMSDTQEGWSDSLYFYRNEMNVEMLGNAQVTDTSRNVSAMAGRIEYIDTLSKVTLTRIPAVISQVEEEGQLDTVYFGADTLMYYTLRRCDIDSSTVAASAQRLKDLDTDPIGTHRKKAAEAAAKAAEEAAMNDPNYVAKLEAEKKKAEAAAKAAAADSLAAATSPAVDSLTPASSSVAVDSLAATPQPAVDSLAAAPQSAADSLSFTLDSLVTIPADSLSTPDTVPVSSDSLSAAADFLTLRDSLGIPTDSLALCDSLALTADSLALRDSLGFTADSLVTSSDSLALADSVALGPQDTTKIGFLRAIKNVKVFRKDMQIVCDSLEYSDIDSLARLFKEPIIWNEITQQFSADSITAVVHNNAMERASLMSNAFIHMQEDEHYCNQIKGTEMLAYFDAQGQLTRFDALGGTNALFFIREQDVVATVNKKEAKMLYAVFENNEIHKVHYYDAAKSDAYPVVQLPKEEHILKGYNWQPEKRPADRFAITSLEPRAPEREYYLRKPRAEFKNTEIYFPGYMDDIYVQISVRDSLQKVRAEQRRIDEIRVAEQARLDSLARVDSIAFALDSIARVDSLAKADSIAAADSIAKLEKIAVSDSLKIKTDSLVKSAPVVLTKEQLKEQRKKEKAAAKEKRNKERDARFEAADKKAAEKLAAKEAKKQAKIREKKRKALRKAEEQARRDAALLEKYLKRLEKKSKPKI